MAAADAIQRLDAALVSLETAVARVVGAESSRADLTDTLALMDDDRQRLATELDAALGRADRLEAAARDVGQRLRAMDAQLAAFDNTDAGPST